MTTIHKRLKKLEKLIPPISDTEAASGKLASLRDAFLLDQAQEHGDEYAAGLKKQLEKNGPWGFRMEMIRAYLKLHGIDQGPNESFAQTLARALGIGTSELSVRIRDGTFGRDLWNKFGDIGKAADNG